MVLIIKTGQICLGNMKNNDFVLHISGRSKMEQGEKLSGSQLYD